MVNTTPEQVLWDLARSDTMPNVIETHRARQSRRCISKHVKSALSRTERVGSAPAGRTERVGGSTDVGEVGRQSPKERQDQTQC